MTEVTEYIRMPGLDLTDPSVRVAIQNRQSMEQEELVRTMLHTAEGRAFVCMLMEEGGLHADPFVSGAPHDTSYNAGKRKLAVWAYEWVLTVAPETYSLMLAEMASRRQRYAEEIIANQEEDDG